MLLTVKYLSQKISFITIRSNQSNMTANQNFAPLTTKTELISFIGSMKMYSEYLDKLLIKMKPLYDLLHGKNNFHWDNELETLFHQVKLSIAKVVVLTLPNTNHPFFITVEFSLIGRGVSFSKGKTKENWIIFQTFLEFLQLMDKNSVLHIVN